jgi:ABC-2 type transport system ATP-binding protein
MKGRTTLLCTHNLDEAQALCEEVVILRAGRVVVSGDIGSLRRSAGPRLRLAARQGIEPLLAAVGQGGIVDGTVEVPVTDPEADAPALLRRLLEQGLDVYLCEPVEASLEDVFIEAVT